MRRNTTTRLSGSNLSRTSTVLPERDVAGEIIGSPHREQGWIEDEHGNPVDLAPSTEPVSAEFIERLTKWASGIASKAIPDAASQVVSRILSLFPNRRGRPRKPFVHSINISALGKIHEHIPAGVKQATDTKRPSTASRW